MGQNHDQISALFAQRGHLPGDGADNIAEFDVTLHMELVPVGRLRRQRAGDADAQINQLSGLIRDLPGQ